MLLLISLLSYFVYYITIILIDISFFFTIKIQKQECIRIQVA